MQSSVVRSQISYLAIIFVLLVIPRMLQRYRIPAPLSCIALRLGTSLVAKEYGADPL